MFKTIIKLAWKNSFSRFSRTLLVILMISISMSMMLSIQGLYDGMTKNMIDNIKRSHSGEISIFAKEYRINKDLNHTIKNAVIIKKELEQLKNISSVSLRLSVDGLSSTARNSSISTIYGIDLKDEEKFGEFSKFLKKGELSFKKNGAFISKELAKTLKIHIGSKVIFSTQDKSGDINSMVLKIRGFVQTGNIALDANTVYVDYKKLYNFLSLDLNEATQIAIRSDDKKLYDKIKSKYKTLDVYNFLEMYPMMKQMEEMMVIFNSITFFIVMIVVFIGIFGVMYVSILDRIREFGIMLSIGMQYKYIKIQIFLEALFVGIIGYISGAILGIFGLTYLKKYGLDLSYFADGMESFGMDTTLYANIELSYFTTTFIAITASSLLSVLIPLRRIKTLNPIEVIKAEK